jgi:hypothetical protein
MELLVVGVETALTGVGIGARANLRIHEDGLVAGRARRAAAAVPHEDELCGASLGRPAGAASQ